MFVMFVNKESGVGSSDLRKGKTYLNWRAKSFEAIERSQPWDKTCWFHRSCPLNALELLRTHTPVILYLVLSSRFSPNLVSPKLCRLCQRIPSRDSQDSTSEEPGECSLHLT